MRVLIVIQYFWPESYHLYWHADGLRDLNLPMVYGIDNCLQCDSLCEY